MFLLLVLAVIASLPAWANIDEAGVTVVEGAVGLPVSLVKLVGGALWFVGELIALPFKGF